ncbi:MAG TPA: HlyD family efflux transporter periplasmic adaptor subunit, partial [Myxococcota bacterium]|nr:HlyD family efflux transporter periplasmic adaptor subunit [Myxococcota bacterium]
LAPADGVILERLAEPGEVVAPGTPIYALGDREHPYVEVFVATKDLAPLRVGQPAEVLIDGLAPRPATIEHIADTTEFTPRYVFSPKERPHLVSRVRLRLVDPELTLHPGLPAFALFPAHASKPSPSQAAAP